MTEEQFDAVIEDTLARLKELLITKAKEYRRFENPMHNFEEGMKYTGQTREQVIYGFALKHIISIADMRKDIAEGKKPKEATVEEKFNDLLVYTLIEKASVLDKVKVPF